MEGEQNPGGGQGIMSDDRELGLCPGGYGKLLKSFKQGSTVIVECLESSVWLLVRKQIRRRQGWRSGSLSGGDHERMMAEPEQ